MLFLLPLLATLVPSVAAYGKGFTNTKVVSAYFPSYQMAPAVRSVAFLFASVFLTPSSPSGRSLRSIHTPRLLRLHHYPGRALFPPFFQFLPLHTLFSTLQASAISQAGIDDSLITEFVTRAHAAGVTTSYTVGGWTGSQYDFLSFPSSLAS